MKYFYIILTLLFVVFLTFYISQAVGYYDYNQYKKVELTKDKISQFEEDIKNGKNVKISDYLDNVSYDYNNTASKVGLKISNTIRSCVKTSVNGFLSFFGLLLNE